LASAFCSRPPPCWLGAFGGGNAVPTAARTDAGPGSMVERGLAQTIRLASLCRRGLHCGALAGSGSARCRTPRRGRPVRFRWSAGKHLLCRSMRAEGFSAQDGALHGPVTGAGSDARIPAEPNFHSDHIGGGPGVETLMLSRSVGSRPATKRDSGRGGDFFWGPQGVVAKSGWFRGLSNESLLLWDKGYRVAHHWRKRSMPPLRRRAGVGSGHITLGAGARMPARWCGSRTGLDHHGRSPWRNAPVSPAAG